MKSILLDKHFLYPNDHARFIIENQLVTSKEFTAQNNGVSFDDLRLRILNVNICSNDDVIVQASMALRYHAFSLLWGGLCLRHTACLSGYRSRIETCRPHVSIRERYALTRPPMCSPPL